MPDRNPVAWNAAISTFFQAGDCCAAQQAFDRMPWPNDVTWSAMIAGYSQNGRARDSLLTFRQMRRAVQLSGLMNPNSIASSLSSCSQLRDLSFGEQVHGYTAKISTYAVSDAFVGAALVDMYGKCGRMGLARLAFDSMALKSVVAWSSLLANYVRENNPLIAIEVFKEMLRSGATPNNVTVTTLISACSQIPQGLLYGNELHAAVVRRRPGKPDIYMSTALVGMYSKCGCVAYAERVFTEDGNILGCRLTALWNAMISGYVANDRLHDALSMVRSMGRFLGNGVCLNSVTLATILPVCSESTSLPHGKELHCFAVKALLDREMLVGNGLLDMYCKCGKINWAQNQFSIMAEKNVISWTTMIDGYGVQGDGHEAIRMFENMIAEENVDPDHVTFVALLSACSHAGLVKEGLQYFHLMTREYGVVPTEEHYACLVDLLGRAGHVDEAKNVITAMPMKPTANVWGALLGACRIHGNVHGAELALRHLIELETKENGFHILLSNIYAQMGKSDGAATVQKKMQDMGISRRPGWSRLKTSNGFHHLLLEDTSPLIDIRS